MRLVPSTTRSTASSTTWAPRTTVSSRAASMAPAWHGRPRPRSFNTGARGRCRGGCARGTGAPWAVDGPAPRSGGWATLPYRGTRPGGRGVGRAHCATAHGGTAPTGTAHGGAGRRAGRADARWRPATRPGRRRPRARGLGGGGAGLGHEVGGDDGVAHGDLLGRDAALSTSSGCRGRAGRGDVARHRPAVTFDTVRGTAMIPPLFGRSTDHRW